MEQLIWTSERGAIAENFKKNADVPSQDRSRVRGSAVRSARKIEKL